MPEMVIDDVPIPYEPEVSDPEALERAQGAGHIEAGDYEQFGKGLYNGLADWFGLPEFDVDERYAGAEQMGRELGQNLALEGAGAVAARGLKAAGALLKGGMKTPKVYPVIMEIQLKTHWPKYLSDAARRGRHYEEGVEEISARIAALRKSPVKEDRALAKQLDRLLENPSDFALHHDPQQEGVMQLIPAAVHQAPEFQDLLHPLVGVVGSQRLRRIGGYFIWGINF